MAESPKVPRKAFEAVIKALLKAPPTTAATIAKKPPGSAPNSERPQ